MWRNKPNTERAAQSLRQAEQALEKAEKDLQEAQANQVQSKASEEKAHQALQKAQAAFEAHHERLQEIEKQRRQLDQERAALSASQAKTKTQWEVLAQAESSLTGYASGTRILLEAARKQRLTGAKGALSSHMQVPAEYETAIAAALGTYLDAVVLEENLDQALDLLVEKAGRGVLLPFQTLHAAPKQAELKNSLPEVLGLASQLVQVSETIAPLIHLLLGQTWIVTDRQTARQVLQDAPSNSRVVTLRGEVFEANGPVHVYASNEQSGSQTLLGRNRQQRELSAQLDQQQAMFTRLEDVIQKLEQDWQAHKAQEQERNQAQQAARKSLDQAANTRQQADLRLEQLKRQADWQKEQCMRLRQEISNDENQTDQLKTELETAEASLVKAREKMRQQNTLLETYALDELQANQAHWRTLVSVSLKALSNSQRRMQERQQACERQEHNIRSLKDQQAQMQATFQELGSKQAGFSAEEEQLSGKLGVLLIQIDPAEAELTQVETQLAGMEKDESASRQALNLAEHQNAQARINLARQQEALQSLRRRIEDDFGLVAFEYVEQVSGPTPLPLEGMVEQLPKVEKLSVEVEEAIKRQRAQLRRIGAINPEAQSEYQEVNGRFVFLNEQVLDLTQAEDDVRQVIAELDQIMEQELLKTFQAVAIEFKQIFTRLFGGGAARLVLTDPEDLTNSGIDIEARLPGRRTQGLSLLSGGERSLTATALIFSLLKVSPTPFCVLDEVDAMLDEANVGRFRELLRELSVNTQFVIVTHNRNTVQVADVIYGVTMGRDSASQVLSLKLDEVSQVVKDD